MNETLLILKAEILNFSNAVIQMKNHFQTVFLKIIVCFPLFST